MAAAFTLTRCSCSRSSRHRGSWLTTVTCSLVTLLALGEISFISCQPGVTAPNGPIRLARNGSVNRHLTSGRVQIYLSRWGHICDDSSFGITEANVICHQLGYTGAISQSNALHEGLGSRSFSSLTLISNMICSSGLLVNIHQCRWSTFVPPTCTRELVATVSCYPTRSWDNPFSGQVRLTGGSTVNQGLVEVYCNGRWGTVCAGRSLGSLAQASGVANSACRQLGYSNTYRVLHLTELSNSSMLNSQPIWVGDMANCVSGGEDCLSYCQSCPNFMFPSCPRQLITVECYTGGPNRPTNRGNTNTTCTIPAVDNGPIQLWRSGTTSLSYTSGRVQLLVRRMWGNICHDSSFNSNAADVICHQLGFTGASSYSREGEDGFGSDNLPQVLSGVHCSISNFLVILQCSHTNTVDTQCTPSDDLSVVCYEARIWDNPSNGRVRLVLGDTVNRGIVEVYCNGQWGRVCGDGFSATAGQTVCRQLGYSDARNSDLPIRRTISALLPVWLNNVRCPSSSPGLRISECQSCPSVARGKCETTDATVECYTGDTSFDEVDGVGSSVDHRILGPVLGSVVGVLAVPLIVIAAIWLNCYIGKKCGNNCENCENYEGCQGCISTSTPSSNSTNGAQTRHVEEGHSSTNTETVSPGVAETHLNTAEASEASSSRQTHEERSPQNQRSAPRPPRQAGPSRAQRSAQFDEPIDEVYPWLRRRLVEMQAQYGMSDTAAHEMVDMAFERLRQQRIETQGRSTAAFNPELFNSLFSQMQNGNSPRPASNAERLPRQPAQTVRPGQDNFWFFVPLETDTSSQGQRLHMPSGATADGVSNTPSDPTITEVAPPPYHTHNEYTTYGDSDEKKPPNDDPPPYYEK